MASIPRATADPRVDVLEQAAAHVRDALGAASAAAAAEGMPPLPLRGQMIRPLVALAVAERLGEAAVSEAFWNGVLAVQLAHEASLVHDDIVDGASTRRGELTLAAERGAGAALVHGDHLLTAAYRVATRTGSPAFVNLFARAVERTVAGEIAQGKAAGGPLDLASYREIATGKAGELLGCALAAAPLIGGWDAVPELSELGRRLGLLYQMVDDLLDYCPAADTGKPPLADYLQSRWTWPLIELADPSFGRPPEEVLAAFAAPSGRGSALRRCLSRLEAAAEGLRVELAQALGESPILQGLLLAWLERTRRAVELQEEAARGARRRREASRSLLQRVPPASEAGVYLGRHSRSFRFASRLFPRAERERVARVYAYCRVTDDLVDRPGAGGAAVAEEMLEEWVELSRRAYGGEPTGIDLLDRVMGEAAAAEVPFAYASELAEGMRMDLRGESYPSLAALRVYTYRVAGVVGLWLSELFGVHDRWALERATSLGHAMQLTNILRDVGEDARRGRIYLPLQLLERHGIPPAELRAAARGERLVDPRYPPLVEELLQLAEADYRDAFAAIPSLPVPVRRPVAVAAFVYRGIHGEIRRRGYDNLRQRASTSAPAKLVLATRALRELGRTPRRGDRGGELVCGP